ncbi:hypothetical protein Tco_0911270 [Tanacetum coccineum]|uniref:Uncharacterized protein n=1 Tax=Tanacetum coccineum TaxID=301880 RepID=A0ABQ5CVB0_9ASTR
MMRATPSPIASPPVRLPPSPSPPMSSPLPLFFLPSPIRPPHTRAAMAQMRDATPSTYHSLLLSETPPLLLIPLHASSTSRRADIPEADMLPQKRLLLTAPTPRYEVGESSAAGATRQLGSTMARRVNYSFVDTIDSNIRSSERGTMAAIEVVNLRISYQADVYRRESKEFYAWLQDTDDHPTRAIMRIQALEAGARVDTLEDTSSSS